MRKFLSLVLMLSLQCAEIALADTSITTDGGTSVAHG